MITLVFDTRSFSNIAELYPAADVVRMLKRYFDALSVPSLYVGSASHIGCTVVGDLGAKHYYRYTINQDEGNLTSR